MNYFLLLRITELVLKIFYLDVFGYNKKSPDKPGSFYLSIKLYFTSSNSASVTLSPPALDSAFSGSPCPAFGSPLAPASAP